MNPKPGEVWLADLGLAAKTRPVLVVSRFDSNPPRALVIYVPLTTQYRNSRYEVPLPKLSFLREESFVNVQGIGSIPRTRLERKLGELPDKVMVQIRQAILFTLNLEPWLTSLSDDHRYGLPSDVAFSTQLFCWQWRSPFNYLVSGEVAFALGFGVAEDNA